MNVSDRPSRRGCHAVVETARRTLVIQQSLCGRHALPWPLGLHAGPGARRQQVRPAHAAEPSLLRIHEYRLVRVLEVGERVFEAVLRWAAVHLRQHHDLVRPPSGGGRGQKNA